MSREVQESAPQLLPARLKAEIKTQTYLLKLLAKHQWGARIDPVPIVWR